MILSTIVIFIILTAILMSGMLASNSELMNKYYTYTKVDNIIQKESILKYAVQNYCKNENVNSDSDLPTIDDLINKDYLPSSFDKSNGFGNNLKIVWETSKKHYYFFDVNQTIDKSKYPIAVQHYEKDFDNEWFGSMPSCNNDGNCTQQVPLSNPCK